MTNLRQLKTDERLWYRFKIWNGWKSVTRCLTLLDQALLTSETVWRSLPLEDPDSVPLVHIRGRYRHACHGRDYIAALKDRHHLCSLALISSYALLETHVIEVLQYGVTHTSADSAFLKDLRKTPEKIAVFTCSGGYEGWGSSLLRELGISWDAVLGGRGGAAEVGAVRNALAHSEAVVTDEMVKRVTGASGQLPWGRDESIVLNLDQTREYRDRMKSFARVIGDSVIRLAKK